MFYDLHIHSGLSPCGDSAMTPNNIARMAVLKGLQLIAVTDHNSLKQQHVMAQVAHEHGLTYLYGVEIQSQEEVHILGYFTTPKAMDAMQKWIEDHQIKVKNRPDFFGEQTLFDSQDRIIEEEPVALIFSLNASLESCIRAIHHKGGKAVLAHLYGRKYGLIQQLGFIPEGLAIDGVELCDPREVPFYKHEYPQYAHLPILCNSDAHQLGDIHEARFTLDEPVIKAWGIR
jgi:predicted metal-dependent phosphoesterase TrpH